MRVVLGDLGWKIHPEPRDYNYAQYMKQELPNKGLEESLLAQVGMGPPALFVYNCGIEWVCLIPFLTYSFFTASSCSIG
jgi:hypothetical protein